MTRLTCFRTVFASLIVTAGISVALAQSPPTTPPASQPETPAPAAPAPPPPPPPAPPRPGDACAYPTGRRCAAHGADRRPVRGGNHADAEDGGDPERQRDLGFSVRDADRFVQEDHRAAGQAGHQGERQFDDRLYLD